MGLYSNTAQAIKCCNSLIGMLYFDTGAKAKAAEFLAKGYVKADIGLELGYKNSNSLTSSSDAIFSAVVSGASFQLNQYAPTFKSDRIADDTFRRVPSNWFASTTIQAENQLRLNYFYPAAPAASVGSIPATSRVAYYPIISANEVALMLVDAAVSPATTAAQRQQVVADVLTSWKIPSAQALILSADPAMTLERVARYEYAGRGRRWAAAGKYAKWPLANEFNFR